MQTITVSVFLLSICFETESQYTHHARSIPARQEAVTPLALGMGVKRLIPLILMTILWSLPSAAELRLKVDLGERELVVLEDGNELERFAVSVGKDKYPTPTGAFRIRKIIWNPSWKPPDSKWAKGKAPRPPGHPENPMKVVKIFFSEPDYYIHGTDDEDSLGKAESHGCLRMTPNDAARLALLVMEHGGTPMQEPWYRRIFRRKTTKVVYLKSPVAIEIRS